MKMDAKTASALQEMFTVAAKQFGVEPGEIIISVCSEQEKMSGKWLEDDEIEAGFDDFDEHDAEAMFMNIHSDEGND